MFKREDLQEGDRCDVECRSLIPNARTDVDWFYPCSHRKITRVVRNGEQIYPVKPQPAQVTWIGVSSNGAVQVCVNFDGSPYYTPAHTPGYSVLGALDALTDGLRTLHRDERAAECDEIMRELKVEIDEVYTALDRTWYVQASDDAISIRVNAPSKLLALRQVRAMLEAAAEVADEFEAESRGS